MLEKLRGKMKKGLMLFAIVAVILMGTAVLPGCNKEQPVEADELVVPESMSSYEVFNTTANAGPQIKTWPFWQGGWSAEYMDPYGMPQGASEEQFIVAFGAMLAEGFYTKRDGKQAGAGLFKSVLWITILRYENPESAKRSFINISETQELQDSTYGGIALKNGTHTLTWWEEESEDWDESTMPCYLIQSGPFVIYLFGRDDVAKDILDRIIVSFGVKDSTSISTLAANIASEKTDSLSLYYGGGNSSNTGGGGGIGGNYSERITGTEGITGTTLKTETGIGKGLKELCSPYRQCIVFGADLETPDANNWNCVPEIIGPTTTFDLSTITPYHEVAVALIAFYDVDSELDVTFKWYRNRDNKLIYQGWYTIPDPCEYGYDYWEWWYVYGYIGYTPEEIWENGDYHLQIVWSPGNSRTLDFHITGIPEPLSLLEKYAPILYFHPGEGYYTDSIESVLNESDLILLNETTGDRKFILSNPTTSQLSSHNTKQYYTDVRNAEPGYGLILPDGSFYNLSALPPEPSRFESCPFTVYGRQVEVDDYICLQYWLFYPYNRWWNCHEGDMERVQILLDKASETPQRMTFGQHWGGETVTWDSANISFMSGTHPEVFVGIGSHSSWPTDGNHVIMSFLNDTIRVTDYTSSTGLALFPDCLSSAWNSYALTNVSSEPSWVGWLGKWGYFVPGPLGGYGRCGPDSPANVVIVYNYTTGEAVNIWDNPIEWADNPGSPSIVGTATGSVRLHAYDSQGNHIGLNETGGIETEIPGTYFYVPASDQSEAELMWIYTSENLTFKLEATGSGESNFSFAKCQSDEVTTNYTHIQITENTTATVSSAQAPFSVMQIDHDGDGFSDESRFPDAMGNSTLIGHVSFPGRGPAPNAKWIETLEVRFFDNATKLEMYWSPVNATTNSSGYFKITHLPASTTI